MAVVPLMRRPVRQPQQPRQPERQLARQARAATHGAPASAAYFKLPNTFFRIALPVPTGSARIFFSSSPIMK